MARLTTAEARDKFADVVNRAAYTDQRTVITRHGKDIAAVVPVSDLELLHELERLIDLDAAKKALTQIQRGKFTSLEDLKKKLNV